MHSSLLVYFGIIAAASILLFKASEYWWSTHEHRRFRERVAELWLALSESRRDTLMRSFLAAISTTIDQLYGDKVLSFRSFVRVQITTAVIYVVALAVIGIREGVPFSMEHPPWQGFDYSFELVNTFAGQMLKTLEEQKIAKSDEKSQKANAAVKEFIEHWSAKLNSYRTERFRVLHSIGCLFFAIILSGFEAFVGFAISRKLLRDLISLTTLTNALAVITCEVLLYCLLYWSTVFFLTLLAIPVTFAGAAVIFGAFWYLPAAFGIGLLLLALWLVGIFAPLWIKVAASVSSLPVALVILAGLGVILLTWLGWPLQRAAVALLDRALRSEKGPVAFFTTVVLLIASLFGLFISR